MPPSRSSHAHVRRQEAERERPPAGGAGAGAGVPSYLVHVAAFAKRLVVAAAPPGARGMMQRAAVLRVRGAGAFDGGRLYGGVPFKGG